MFRMKVFEKIVNIVKEIIKTKEDIAIIVLHEIDSQKFIDNVLLLDGEIEYFVKSSNIDFYKGKIFRTTTDCVREIINDYIFEMDIFDELLRDRIFENSYHHMKVLSKKQKQSICKDEYGNELKDRWITEVDYFINNVLRKDVIIDKYLTHFTYSHDEIVHKKMHIGNVLDSIIAWYRENEGKNEISSLDIEQMSPLDFEHACADILRDSGWSVRVTQASNDQGIDIVASFGDVKAVFQCKKYSQPVGNAAVQEIIAGKEFEQANIAVVVSSNTYTPSAKQLANATGVFLLHYEELIMLSESLAESDK